MNNTDYRDYVSMLARNGIEMGETPRVVASTVLVDTENVGDEKAIRLSAEPFVDEPSTQTRLWPKDVITGSDHNLLSSQPDEFRDLAFEILVNDVYEAMFQIENNLR